MFLRTSGTMPYIKVFFQFLFWETLNVTKIITRYVKGLINKSKIDSNFCLTSSFVTGAPGVVLCTWNSNCNHMSCNYIILDIVKSLSSYRTYTHVPENVYCIRDTTTRHDTFINDQLIGEYNIYIYIYTSMQG